MWFWCESSGPSVGAGKFNFAQWRYSNQWSNREVLLLLVENYTQYPGLTGWNTLVWANFWRLLRKQIYNGAETETSKYSETIVWIITYVPKSGSLVLNTLHSGVDIYHPYVTKHILGDSALSRIKWLANILGDTFASYIQGWGLRKRREEIVFKRWALEDEMILFCRKNTIDGGWVWVEGVVLSTFNWI